MKRSDLRKIEYNISGETEIGFFHKWIYNYNIDTLYAIIEARDGRILKIEFNRSNGEVNNWIVLNSIHFLLDQR